MEQQVLTGSSLLVPSLQDLIKENITTIPERYVRHDQEPTVINGTSALAQIPIIDFERLNSNEDCARSELQRLHEACRDWGFFQLINHGVSPVLIENVKRGTLELFNLPKEEKEKYAQKAGKLEGFGQAFVLSEEQKLEWADAFYVKTLPKSVREPHLFPKLPLPHRDDLEAYCEETQKLAIKILYLMAKALGMKAQEVTELFEDGLQGMRMNYYPPCPQPELVIGLTPHSDADALTILLQVNEMDGLQIRKDGKWIPVNSLPDAFIINVGDIIEMVTNGIYRSIDHRATVNAIKERVSIALFHSPKMDAVIGPAASLVTPETPAQFRRISVIDHLNGYFKSELQGKAYLDAMRIKIFDGKK